VALLVGGCRREGRQEIEEKVITTVEHIPPGAVIDGGNAVIRVTVESTAPPEQQTVVLYYRIGQDWTGVPLKPVGDESLYEAEIPRQPRGTVVGYYIEVRTAAGSQVRLPAEAPERLYVVKFQGAAPEWLGVSHNLLLYTGLVLTLVASVLAYLVLKGRTNFLSKIPFLIGLAALLYGIGGILLQMLLSWYVDARLWAGFPVGSNPADTKSLVIVLFWGILAFLTRTRFFRGQEESVVVRGTQLAVLVLAGTILTIVLFLLPQDSILT
jgi:hypothetical protein